MDDPRWVGFWGLEGWEQHNQVLEHQRLAVTQDVSDEARRGEHEAKQPDDPRCAFPMPRQRALRAIDAPRLTCLSVEQAQSDD